MLTLIKLSLRIVSSAFDDEITALIEACKLDLKNAGIGVIDETDPLIRRTVTLYCKAGFGYGEGQEKFYEAYEYLKRALSLAGDYT